MTHIEVTPTLAAMADVYRLPREGGAASPRFKRYLELIPATRALSAFNPMAGPHVLETTEQLLEVDAGGALWRPRHHRAWLGPGGNRRAWRIPLGDRPGRAAAQSGGCGRGPARDRGVLKARYGSKSLMSRRTVVRILMAGVALIFGGEATCILGPDQRSVYVGCHIVLYAGMFLVVAGVVLEGRRRYRTRGSGDY